MWWSVGPDFETTLDSQKTRKFHVSCRRCKGIEDHNVWLQMDGCRMSMLLDLGYDCFPSEPGWLQGCHCLKSDVQQYCSQSLASKFVHDFWSERSQFSCGSRTSCLSQNLISHVEPAKISGQDQKLEGLKMLEYQPGSAPKKLFPNRRTYRCNWSCSVKPRERFVQSVWDSRTLWKAFRALWEPEQIRKNAVPGHISWSAQHQHHRHRHSHSHFYCRYQT